MRKLASLSLCLALVLAAVPAAPVLADHPGSAKPRDIQRVQDDLYTLEQSLRDVPAGHARATEFRDRAEEIRESVTYLRVQMRRHQRNRGAEGLGTSLEDVEWVRQDIAKLQDDIYTAMNMRYSGGEAALRVGTELQVRLDQPISSGTARAEDRIEATVVTPVRLDNRVVVPAGTRVRGVVRRAERAERPAKGGSLDLEFNTLLLTDNTRIDIDSRVMSVKEDVDRGDTAQKAGVGAALGALLGSVIGGTKGALLGILVGGAGGAITSRGDEVVLPEGTILTLNLEKPVSIRR